MLLGNGHPALDASPHPGRDVPRCIRKNLFDGVLRLKEKELIAIKEFIKYEEPRVIRRANILNCLHHGYSSGEISLILNVDPKTVTNVGNTYLEEGFDSALYDDERSGRPIDFDDREKSRIIAMVCTNPPSGSYRWL